MTGLTSIEVTRTARVPAAKIVVALTPIGRYRTVVRWTTTFDGAGRRFGRHTAGAAAHAARLRASSRAESAVDATEAAVDPAVDVLRDLRRARQ